MKHTLKSLLIIAALWLVGVRDAQCATAPRGVNVTYAFVPKERLAEAVKGKTEALAIEAAWRKEAMARTGLDPYPNNVRHVHYSVVVFVEIPASFALWGRIGIPVQHPRNPLIANVRLSPGYTGTYVIDGGGIGLAKGIPPEPKPYEWLDVTTE